MLIEVVQRLVRLAPAAARRAWHLTPEFLRRRLSPLVYPVAVGPRSGGRPLDVPVGGRRSVVVVLADEREGSAPSYPADARIEVLNGDASALSFARARSIADAVVRCVSGDARLPDFLALGWRITHSAPASLADLFPSVSVIIVSFQNPALVEACLRAVLRNTPWPRLEVLVVDNASGEPTLSRIRELSRLESRIRLIANSSNRGYARACNQGLRAATGQFVAMLNDDTVVGPGWLARLVAHLERSPRLGLVCPSTNQIGNEAKIPTRYTSLEEMERFALETGFENAGRLEPTRSLALFCAVGRRATLEAVGYLDERFEVGMFEDDDLSLALQRAGYSLGIARDAFVHHVGQASFARLDDARYLAIWRANRRRFEDKWGVPWVQPGGGAS